MIQTANSQGALWFAGGICLLLVAGCGSSSGREGLDGTVTFDGEPLVQGNIRFLPQQGTKGPTAGGKIADGYFSIDRDKGTFVGTFSVEIIATRKTGRKVESPFGGSIDEHEQYLPEQYNRKSELVADVTDDGTNRFEFVLSSQ